MADKPFRPMRLAVWVALGLVAVGVAAFVGYGWWLVQGLQP